MWKSFAVQYSLCCVSGDPGQGGRSYRGDEAIDWLGFSRLWSQTVGYAVTTSRKAE